jgi:Sigma-70 region 2
MIEEPVTPDSEKNLNSEKIAEEKAIHLAQCGDASRFEQLYRKYNRYVYALCLRMTKNAAEAEDLTQEAFLQAFRKIHTFRSESRLHVAASSDRQYRVDPLSQKATPTSIAGRDDGAKRRI